MVVRILLKLFYYYIIYKLVRSAIDYFTAPKTTQNAPLKKKSQVASGPVIEAEYRVLSNKD